MKKNIYKSGIVTGCSKGIGLATSVFLLEKNYRIFAISRKINNKIKYLQKKYKEFFFFQQDITKISETESLIKKILKFDKKVSFLVNNAGIRSRLPISKITFEDANELYINNYFSHFNITKTFIESTNARLKRSIVMLGSIVGSRGFSNLSNYSFTKGAIESFTKSVAIEYAKKNIRCNCISPGFIKTSYFNKFKSTKKKLHKWTLSRIPMGRWGNSNEIAPLVELLISEKSSYITGTTIFVDGGWTAS
jgi:NAD(P)-dependent dehydrogenase (short-subunit alcohol dehydrogenase family)